MDKKSLAAIGVLVAIVAVVAVLFERTEAPDGTPPSSGSEANPPNEQTFPAPSPIQAKGTQKGGVAITSKRETGLTYQEVVDKYQDARIQFNNNCQAAPSRSTFKNGTFVMFDNRETVKRIIALDGRGYLIGPYGFIVLSLSYKTLPHTVKLDCDQQYNVGSILIQP